MRWLLTRLRVCGVERRDRIATAAVSHCLQRRYTSSAGESRRDVDSETAERVVSSAHSGTRSLLIDSSSMTHEEPNLNDTSLVTALESMQQTLDAVSLPIVGGAALDVSSSNDMTINRELERALNRWPDVFHRLRTTALPVLLQTSNTTPPSLSSVKEACQTLTETLSIVEEVSKATGMRMERMFPAALVVVLWNCLARIYVHAVHVSSEQHGDGKALIASAAAERPPSLLKELKRSRRALALRTRELNDLIPPSALVRVLLCMEQCGAISDDIIGPIGTQLLRRHKTSVAPLNGPQHVATNHLLSARFVAAPVDSEDAPFQGETAVAFARLLGRLNVKKHFQLHRLMHTILLPQVMVSLQDISPDDSVLFDLTKCYARYAVSGSAVSQLTSLWMPHLSRMTLDKCSELLSIVGGGNSATVGAEEDYFPLVEALLERASLLYHYASQDSSNVVSSTGTGIVPSVVSTADAVMNVDSVAKFICALSTVNSAHWEEVYLLAATALNRSLDKLLTADVVRVTRALLRRNSHVPYHSLHSSLAQRLLNDETALTDTKMGGLSLLAAALMSFSGPSPHESQMAVVKHSETTNDESSALDADRALAVFRRHGKALGLRSFVAGMCVSSLAQLPRRSQEGVIMHFTSIASALEVSWLVRGIVSLISQIPQAVDPVSVQRWFSRFTATDVSRQLDLEQTAALLNILSHDDYSRDCALAKQAVVKQTGKLLLQSSFPLETVAPLVTALQRANVFFPPLFSRVCRALLAEVRQAPWRLLLPAFYVMADEFTRRPHSNGSVFRDVWEQLRSRIMDDAALSMEAEDVVLALNGFAALDGRDFPVFSVLLHRLWTLYEGVAVSSEANDDSCATKMVTVSALTPTAWVDSLLAGCTPSALAVLITTLIRAGQDKVINTFLPWVLLRTRPVVKDLYPIDVVHLMPALLSCFTAANTVKENVNSDSTMWLCNPVNQTILHATYDECRELFLHMYEDTMTARDANALQTQRAEWSPKVRVSVSRVPRYLFAELLIALCQCEVRDEAVAIASASRLTRRSCAVLPVAELVDLTMALCFHFPPPLPSPKEEIIVMDGDKNDDCDMKAKNEDSGAAATATLSPLAPHQRFLPHVLTALWDRVEELQATHIDALIRCLRYYYGDKVDDDFLDRLMQHKAALAEVGKRQRQQPQEKASHDGGEKNVAAEVEQKQSARCELMAEDLFAL